MKQQLTRWQCFAKKFSETEGKDQVLLNVILPYGYICAEGKVAKVINNAHFNKEASKHYGALTEDERNEFVRGVSPEVELTKQDVTRKARKVMSHIQDKVHFT